MRVILWGCTKMRKATPPKRSAISPTRTNGTKKLPAHDNCYFLSNIDFIGNSLKEILSDYSSFSDEQKEVAKVQTAQIGKLNENLETITSKIDSSFKLGESFVKLFRLCLMTMLFVVLSFSAIIVYITNIDIRSEYFSLTNNASAQPNESSNK